jgi:CheY-like chemotaxis protein
MHQGHSALIVDDDQRVAELVGAVLSVEGFDVTTARDGVQGFDSYFHHPTDCVVTDVDMPRLNGVEMATCIRAINPGVKIVYMTGALDDYRCLLDREARQFGARILRKPFTRAKLVEQVSEIQGQAK